MESEEFEVRFGIGARVATLAFDERIRAVEFHEKLLARAGEAMEPIDVLRHDRADFSRALQPHDGVMHRVRFRITKSIAPLEFVIPMLAARLFRRHEILVVNRLPFRPDAARSAEIGNAAAGRDAGARENENAPRAAQVIGQSHLALIGEKFTADEPLGKPGRCFASVTGRLNFVIGGRQ